MKQLADALTGLTNDDPSAPANWDHLLPAAKTWACYCLENMTGDLLARGLEISRAIAQFDAGAKNPQTLKD